MMGRLGSRRRTAPPRLAPIAPVPTLPERRRWVLAYDGVLFVIALVIVALEALEWRDNLPDFRPVSIVALAALPLLIRNSIPVSTGTYSATVALAPAVLYSAAFDGGSHIFPLWALIVFCSYSLLRGRPSVRNPRVAIQILAGAALMEVATATRLGFHPYDRVLTGIAAYLAVLAALEFPRHWIRTNQSRLRVLEPLNLAAAVIALLLSSTSVAVLRRMQAEGQGFGVLNTPEGQAPGTVPVLGITLIAACVLLAKVERQLLITATLSDAAVAMPWPGDQIDELLKETSRRGLRARTAEIRAEPDGRQSLSLELRDGRFLVLTRGRGDLGFQRSEEKLARALVAMAEGSRAQATHEQVLIQAANTDALSGLWTHPFFNTCLSTALAERAPTENIAVLFIDLDDFKFVNESLGHLVADDVIRTLGERLLSGLPVDSFPSRFGGDEFVLLFRHVHGASHLESLKHQVTALVGEHITVEGEVLQMSCTIGAALSSPSRNSASGLLQDAELEMRSLKAARRAIPRPRWAPEVALLRDLVDEGDIGVAYQPLIDLRTNSLYGYEALVRAHHPAFGPLSPLQTIGSAIRLGILDEVTEIIAEQAFVAVDRVAQRIGRELTLSINIEYQQLRDGNPLLDWVCERKESHGFPVVLELSERKIGAWHSVHEHVARNLRDCGVELALDDFGAGNATFNVVSEWDWGWVKIDRAFLSSMGERGLTMLPHVVRMLHELGTTAVLEGIETREQLGFARELSIPLAQGHRLGTPQSAEEILTDQTVHGLDVTDLLSD